MTAIRCTKKLLKEMGLKSADLSDASQEALLGDWYGNLFYHNGKKCLLFAAEKTLLCFVVTEVTRKQIRKLEVVFREGLFRLLLEEGFQPNQVSQLLDECREIEYAATADRGMIGSMNELVKEAQFWLEQLGSPAAPDIAAIHQTLNRNPLKQISYKFAIDVSKELLIG
jgi:hypothetical protein